MKTKITFAIIVLITFVFGGSAVAKPVTEAPTTEDTVKYSGFLGDYKDFKVVNPETKAELWIKPPHQDLTILQGYKAIVFSPIEIWMHSTSEYQGIDPSELKLITDYFLDKLQKNLGKHYEIVEESGPNVMNMRIAITGLKKNKPNFKAYDLIPVKLVWDAGNAAYRKAAGKQLDVYEATLEIEIRDTENHERLVAAVDKHQIEAATEKGEDTWKPLEKVIDYWVRIISNRLNKEAKASPSKN